jgi:toxin ParE1/3/4
MIKYRITPRASRDLYDIANYSARAWGNKQKNLYVGKLKARIEWLSENPQLGKVREDIQGGIRSYSEGDHIIFFQIDGSFIEIIAILHSRMDVVSKLN